MTTLSDLLSMELDFHGEFQSDILSELNKKLL